MKVVFFNHFHNGDIHVSRSMVRHIINRLPSTTFAYSHRNPPNILSDIPRLEYSNTGVEFINEHTSLSKVGDIIYFNTWYAQQKFKHMNTLGLTFDALYAGIDENCQNAFGFSLSDISEDPKIFYPEIDYSKFEIGHAQKWLKENPVKKILIENGQALSGQSDNFNMTQAIANVAANHLDKIFILSNHDNIPLPNNCIYADGIIKKSQRSDLNEISFLSSQCDLIIGRASGVFTFALTQYNLFERPAKFLCFYNLPAQNQQYWLGPMFKDKIQYSANIVTHNETNINRIQDIIQQNLDAI